jgi:hypothetical protein
MDELDKLKNHWKQNEPSFKQISENEIYGMLHKKSSSVVKWILIISIMEFLFQLGLPFLIKDSPSTDGLNSLKLDHLIGPMTIIYFAIILYFVYKFYINYKKITATDTVKNLMVNILNTRKTVNAYIYANLTYMLISAVVIIIALFKTDANLINALQQSKASGHEIVFYLEVFLLFVVFIGILIFLMWLFYRLIYGLLLKRLHRNYEELKKIDF